MIANSYASGLLSLNGGSPVEAKLYAGGAVGRNRSENGTIQSCFWWSDEARGDGVTEGLGLNADEQYAPFPLDAAGRITPLDSAEFRNREVFTSQGWDFDHIWTYSQENGGAFPVQDIRRPHPHSDESRHAEDGRSRGAQSVSGTAEALPNSMSR